MSLFCSFSIYADNGEIEQLINDANTKYSENSFSAAIELYSKVINSGFESADLYYNMGNAYFKNKQNAYAILYYEKAKLLAPHNKKIDHNLRFAQQFVQDEIKEVPQFFLTKFLSKFVRINKTDTWAIISFSLFGLTLLSLLFMFFSKVLNQKRLALVLAVFLFVSSLTTFAFAFKMKQITSVDNYGVILNVVTVKSSPDESSTDLYILHEGVKIEIEDNLNGWYEIKLLDGRIGWVKAEILGII